MCPRRDARAPASGWIIAGWCADRGRGYADWHIDHRCGAFLLSSAHGRVVVLGGTLWITLVTTPRNALLYSARRCLDLLAASDADPEALIEQSTECARVRRRGLAALELYLPKIEDRFLRKGLQIGLELTDRAEIRTVFETELRIAERQGRRTGSLAPRIA